ncbi:MAG: nickel-dependent hydrogenase large subunit [Candidatus Omnitrophota bacterium]|jgi:ferredoxin hydrogenase large subunit/hydrogenase large subunit|nr:MAG: nickel-dependent hydrogenase large subunit [Candidatus Omnitrophota bacterium]
MAKTITIDPLTRIEGHLAIRLEVEAGRVVKAFSAGEMFRGFEVILKNRHPMDAQQITQRICGVCPISHGTASILAQDEAYGIKPPPNGRIVRNLILGANYIQSHIIHFYQLSALDFVDIAAVKDYTGNDQQLRALKGWIADQISSKVMYPAAPFLPRYEAKYLENAELNIAAVKHYLQALDMRAMAHQMAALFCGKIPHAPALIPGGVTEKVTADKIAAYQSRLQKLQQFINECYLPDVMALAAAFPDYLRMGKGCGNFLAYGVFPEDADHSQMLFPSGVMSNGRVNPFNPTQITEDVRYSLFSSPSGLPPSQGQTEASPHKHDAYSWLKAPRYGGQVLEVGPLARILIAYAKGGNAEIGKQVDAFLAQMYGGPEMLVSTMGRHAARAIETKIVADRCAEWLDQLIPGEPTFRDFTIAETGRGVGLTEAPRGALGHWLDIQNGKIANYQCVVPTTWNCSPRDDRGIAGPIEQSLEETPVEDENNPIEATRVVRSFDPCLACAVH